MIKKDRTWKYKKDTRRSTVTDKFGYKNKVFNYQLFKYIQKKGKIYLIYPKQIYNLIGFLKYFARALKNLSLK